MTYRITPIRASATFELRQTVLRPHQAVDEMALPDDDGPSTATFAAIDDQGEVVATGRVAPAEPPASVGAVAAQRSAWQLRGMATRSDLRNRGIGSAVVVAAIDHVAALGGGLLWCNARLAAHPLYRRAGFTEYGEPWDEPHIGPHIVMALVVPSAGDRDR